MSSFEKRRQKHVTGKGGPGAAEQGNQLSEDEHRLWRQVTRSAEPLTDARARVAFVAGIDDWRSGRARQVDKALPVRRLDGGPAPAARPSRNPGTASALSSGPPPRQTGLDRRKSRKIASGRIGIDARIDLHGMRQREAHATLRRFLFDCVGKGLALVLVITGKGGASGSRSGYDDERGVLKRNVPRWMAEPDLAALIASYSGAHSRHGGEGALYVQLKKRKPLVL